MLDKIKSYIILGLVLLIGGLIAFGVLKDRKLAQQDNLIKASTDTLHKFKTTIGNQGVYISTLVGDKNSLIEILQSKVKQDSSNQILIDSLKKDNKIQSGSIVNVNSNSNYSHKIDTIYGKISFKDSIKTKWYDASIKVDSGISNWNIKTRDKLVLINKLKPNKGLFSGSTLTSYAQSLNKDEDVSGLTSISTVIDKPKVRIAPAIGIGYNTDLSGKNGRFGFNAGVVITFK